MKVTKYVHSCLLVESDSRVAVIDPGSFSWESGLFDVASLERLDDIIITHEHEDHCHLPFVQALVAKFPQVQIATNAAVAAKLQAAGLTHVTIENAPTVEFFPAAHEPIEPLGSTPDNVGFHYLDRLTVPGDSFQLSETKAVLALPITAPWGALTQAIKVAIDLQPQYILPVHDWHWNKEARQQTYERLATLFAGLGITFVKLIDGEPVEL